MKSMDVVSLQCSAESNLSNMLEKKNTKKCVPAELFHTPIRNSAMGMCSTMARVGALLAPTIADLDSVAAFLPFVIMGGGAIVVGLLAFLLPETRGHNLPETLEEAEALGK